MPPLPAAAFLAAALLRRRVRFRWRSSTAVGMASNTEVGMSSKTELGRGAYIKDVRTGRGRG